MSRSRLRTHVVSEAACLFPQVRPSCGVQWAWAGAPGQESRPAGARAWAEARAGEQGRPVPGMVEDGVQAVVSSW